MQNNAMVQIKHCDGSNRASQCFFCLFIICQKTVLRATVLHFLSIFGVLRRFYVILQPKKLIYIKI